MLSVEFSPDFESNCVNIPRCLQKHFIPSDEPLNVMPTRFTRPSPATASIMQVELTNFRRYCTDVRDAALRIGSDISDMLANN